MPPTLPTSSRLNLVNKRILALNDWDKLQDYVEGQAEMSFKALFDTPAAIQNLIDVDPVGNNMVYLSCTGDIAFFAQGDDGGLVNRIGALQLSDLTDPEFNNIKIPPGAGTYYLHARITEKYAGVFQNPRTDIIEYGDRVRIMGVDGTPDLVTDNGDGTITLRVNTLLSATGDQAGRYVTVYLKPIDDGGSVGPQSTVEATAIETKTVVWTGSNNEITTTGDLGQSTISTTPGDYVVVLNGPLTSSSASGGSGALTLASVVSVASGNPIPAGNIDTSMQKVVEASLGGLGEITYKCGHGRVKIKIDLITGEAGTSESQITISDVSGPTTLFEVDGRGWTQTPKVHSPSASLLFEDSIATTAIPFTSAGGVSAPSSFAQSILDSLNEAKKGNEERIWNGVVSGGEVTDGGGLDADISALTAWIKGRRVVIAGDSLTLPGSSTSYIYVAGDTDSFQQTTTRSTAFTPNNVVLAVVVTGASTISSITNVRQFQGKERRHVVVVNEDASIGDFPSLRVALNWLTEIYSLSSNDWPGAKIIISGVHTITAAIGKSAVLIPNVVIEGSGPGHLLRWTFDDATYGPLFELGANADGFKIRNLNIDYQNNTLNGRFLECAATAAVDKVTIEGCEFSKSGTSGYIDWLVYNDSTTRSYWIIQGNRTDGACLNGFECGNAYGWLIINNIIILFSSTTEQKIVNMAAGSIGTQVSMNITQNGGIWLGSYCKAIGNTVNGNSYLTRGIDGDAGDGNLIICNFVTGVEGASPQGINIGDKGVVLGNVVTSQQPSTAGGSAIYTNAQAVIQDNVIHDIEGYGIEVGSVAQYAIISGNRISSFSKAGSTFDGISCSGDKCSVVGNTVTGNNGTGYGIEIEAASTSTVCQLNSTVSYNDAGTTTLDGANTTNNNQVG